MDDRYPTPTGPQRTVRVDELANRVRTGALVLDREEPGWRDQISLEELEMESCARCIVGQVMGLDDGNETHANWRYEGIIASWFGVREGSIASDQRQYANGFLADGGDEWNELRDAWIGYIKGAWE